MKKLCILLALLLTLTGCGAAETFETLANVCGENQPEPKEVVLSAPEDAQVIGGTDGRLYLCDGYDIAVETLAGTDLDATLRQVSGFGADDLTVMETVQTELSRYEWVWTAAGEGGDTVCRSVVLSDGDYHYCVTVSAPAKAAGSLTDTWNALLASVTLG